MVRRRVGEKIVVVVIAAAADIRGQAVASCRNVIFNRIVAKVGILGSVNTNLHGIFNNHSGKCRSRLIRTHRRTLGRVTSHTGGHNYSTIINIGVSCRILNSSGKVLVIAYDKATMGLGWGVPRTRYYRTLLHLWELLLGKNCRLPRVNSRGGSRASMVKAVVVLFTDVLAVLKLSSGGGGTWLWGASHLGHNIFLFYRLPPVLVNND